MCACVCVRVCVSVSVCECVLHSPKAVAFNLGLSHLSEHLSDGETNYLITVSSYGGLPSLSQRRLAQGDNEHLKHNIRCECVCVCVCVCVCFSVCVVMALG